MPDDIVIRYVVFLLSRFALSVIMLRRGHWRTNTLILGYKAWITDCKNASYSIICHGWRASGAWKGLSPSPLNFCWLTASRTLSRTGIGNNSFTFTFCSQFLLLARYTFAKRIILTTDLSFAKFRIAISPQRIMRSLHVWFCRVGFSGTADRMALFPVRSNPRWRPWDWSYTYFGREGNFSYLRYEEA